MAMSLPFTVAPELVTLKGGLTVSVAALRVLWGLEDRHFDLQVDGDLLLVRPKSRLTPDDDQVLCRLCRAQAADL